MTKKKTKKPEARPLPLPLPPSPVNNNPKPKKKTKPKIDKTRYYVFDVRFGGNLDVFPTFEKAMDYVNNNILVEMDGETPDDDDLILIKGEEIGLYYETAVTAKRR